MKKILKRIGAYFIDMMVVMLITQCLSGVPFINKQLDTYNKYYQEYSNALKEYSEFKLELQNSFKDEKITEKEYNKIKTELKELVPIENTINNAKYIENIHNLVKNNGIRFELSEEELDLAKKLIK